jgi:hypothetical protein
MRKQQLMALFLGILFLVSAGCEKPQSLPTEQDAQKVYEHNLKQMGLDKALRVVSFKKVNGQQERVLGVDTYTVYYEAQTERLPSDPTHKAGTMETHKGNLSFQKTEKGWLGPDKEVY